jgi:hypothetical protein
MDWKMTLLVVVLAMSTFILLKRSRRYPLEVGLYIQFRESCSRAGFKADAGVAPLLLLDELARVGHPAHTRARRLVDYYLRFRFGGQELNALQQQEMRSDLSKARHALRSTRAPTRL